MLLVFMVTGNRRVLDRFQAVISLVTYAGYIAVNILLVGITLRSSSILMKALGEAGSKALSKLMSLLLAAIATTLIRKGLTTIIGQS